MRRFISAYSAAPSVLFATSVLTFTSLPALAQNSFTIETGMSSNFSGSYSEQTSITIEEDAVLFPVDLGSAVDLSEAGLATGITLSSLDDTVTNAGTISDGSASFNTTSVTLEIDLGDGNDTFSNSGTLNGQFELGAGDDTYVWDGSTAALGTDATVSGGDGTADVIDLGGSDTSDAPGEVTQADLDKLTGFEGLSISSGTWEVTPDISFDTLAVNGGSLALNGAGTFASGTSISDGLLLVNNSLTSDLVIGSLDGTGSAILSGSGTVIGSVQNYGTINAGDVGTIGSLTIDGDVTSLDGSDLEFDVNPVTGERDFLTITGDLDLQGTAAFDVNWLAEAPEEGNFVLQIMKVDGDFDGVIDTITELPEDTYLVLEPLTGHFYLWSGDTDPLSIATGDLPFPLDNNLALQTALAADGISTTLVKSLTSEQLSILAPELQAAATRGAIDATKAFATNIMRRSLDPQLSSAVFAAQPNCSDIWGEANYCAPTERQWDVWADTSLTLGKIDSGNGLEGDQQRWAINTGADRKLKDTVVGFAGGFSHIKNDTDEHGDSVTRQLAIAATASQEVSILEFQSAFAASYSWGELDREVGNLSASAFNHAYESKHNATSALLEAQVHATLETGTGFELLPTVGTRYIYTSASNTRETAQGNYSSLGMDFRDDETSQLNLILGAKAQQSFEANGVLIRAGVSANFDQPLAGNQIETTYFYNDSGTKTRLEWDVDLPEYAMNLGASVNLEMADNMAGFFGYDYGFSGESKSHSLQAGFRYAF